MSKVILFNGPKLCGKDVAISYLKRQGLPLTVRECKDKLHTLTQEFFCVQPERYWEIYNNRDLKEKSMPEFEIKLSNGDLILLQSILGYKLSSKDDEWYPEVKYVGDSVWRLSIREAMIYVSEVICKPRFGQQYFGEARAKSIRENEWVVDGSTGFTEELIPLIDRVGQDNILLLRIHREGCTFEGDSRSYIPDGVIKNTVDIHNNGTEVQYFEEVEEIVRRFLLDKDNSN